MELPQQLKTAIEMQLQGMPLSGISAAASSLSERYRAEKQQNRLPHINSPADAAAYIAYRMTATYAAAYAAMDMVRQRMHGFAPSSLLDAGAGPGTAMWAAAQIWPGIREITLLERDRNMAALGKNIAAYSQHETVRLSRYRDTDLAAEWSVQPAGLAVCCYVLNELTEKEREKLVERLWRHTEGILLILEPGTKAGYLNIMKAREQLLSAGARTIAPCPHDRACPLDETDWCHFSQRIARTALHRRAKGGELPYEDEKFSLLCMARNEPLPMKGIVIRHPQIRKGCVELKLCTPDGVKPQIVTKKDGEEYKRARNMRWGSILD